MLLFGAPPGGISATAGKALAYTEANLNLTRLRSVPPAFVNRIRQVALELRTATSDLQVQAAGLRSGVELGVV